MRYSMTSQYVYTICTDQIWLIYISFSLLDPLNSSLLGLSKIYELGDGEVAQRLRVSAH